VAYRTGILAEDWRLWSGRHIRCSIAQA
jgi:hypothetical protein